MSRYPELDEHIKLLKQDENHMKYFRQFALENINSDPKYVKKVFEHLLELVKEWNYKSAEHWCLVYIGWCENFTNNFLEASTTHLIANEFFEKEQDVEGIITTCNALLSDYLNLGEIELAIRNGIRGIELANEVKDECNLIALLLNTAETYIESENYDEALALVERLRSYNYTIKVTDEVIILGILSKISLNDNKLKEAYEYCNKALEIMEKNHDIIDREELMGTRAEINYRIGNYDEAVREFEEIIEMTGRNNDPYFKIKTLIRWAKCYYNLGQYNFSKAKLLLVINSERLNDYIRIRVKAYELLKDIYIKLGEYEKALEAFKKYDEYKDKSNINHSNLWLSVLKYKSAANEAKAYKSLYKKIDLISEIGRKITSSLDLEEILKSIHEEIEKIVDTDILGIALYNKEKNMLNYDFFIKDGKRFQKSEKAINDNTSFGAYCFNSKKEILINDIVNEYWKYIDKSGISEEKLRRLSTSVIYLPILMNDEPIALLTVQSDKKNAYTRHDISGLKILASYIAIAIENGKLFNEVNYFANNDVLTGVLNRNGIIRNGEEMLINNRNCSNSIIMMDIDYFKTINDTWGHHAGDIVLKSVAEIASDKIKEYGSIGRYGGEEFLIILPNSDLAKAKKIGESIRKAIEQYNYPIDNNKYGRITASFGIYEFVNTHESLLDGLKKADQALYKAKASGKNMCISYVEEFN